MTDTPETRAATIRHGTLAALTLCTFLIHGYHPLAEDGGLYVAGVQSALDPTLFPHSLAFVSATSHYSHFATLMAMLVRVLPLQLSYLLLFIDLAGIWLLLYAAWRIAALCFLCRRAQATAVALFAACYTLPIAGTSLFLMDPYVTARTFSTPLSLLAIAFALDVNVNPQKTSRNNSVAMLACFLCLLSAAALHLLMAAYAASFVAALLVASRPSQRHRRIGWMCLAAIATVTAAAIQFTSLPDSPAAAAAASSRYYWFLGQWQWFECLGLPGPLIVLALLSLAARPALPRSSIHPTARLIRVAIFLGVLATAIALLFARESFASHAVARLQPLRIFLPIYAVMLLLLGAALADLTFRRASKIADRFQRLLLTLAPPALILALGGVMLFVQLQTFPASRHLELPWLSATNPWSQAFLWARDHTPPNALFAVDADYITTPGEDAQTFRATAQRSVLPDFSKDGGEAAVRPALADDWFNGQRVQSHLSALTDAERVQRLHPLGVTWVILHTGAKTNGACPYANAVVKVCSLLP